MENRERENTCVVEGSLDASTVEAMSAELVEMEAGRLREVSNRDMDGIVCRLTEFLFPNCSQKTQHSCRGVVS